MCTAGATGRHLGLWNDALTAGTRTNGAVVIASQARMQQPWSASSRKRPSAAAPQDRRAPDCAALKQGLLMAQNPEQRALDSACVQAMQRMLSLGGGSMAKQATGAGRQACSWPHLAETANKPLGSRLLRVNLQEHQPRKRCRISQRLIETSQQEGFRAQVKLGDLIIQRGAISPQATRLDYFRLWWIGMAL